MTSPEINLADKKLLSRYIAHFSRHTFVEFFAELFNDKSVYYGLYPLPEAGEDVFYRPYLDSYGGSIHEALLLHFAPLELFRPADRLTLNDPTLITKLAKIRTFTVAESDNGAWSIPI